MPLTDGQTEALEQLQAIAEAGDAVRIRDLIEPTEDRSFLMAEVSLRTRGISGTSDGVRLKARERFRIAVPADFPFSPPSVWVTHNRWASVPHVQWSHHLCLYQSTATEWSPADGMFGLFDRLMTWLAAAARGEMDAVGGPIHPPAVYHDWKLPLFVPQADTPAVRTSPWFGFGSLQRVGDHRVDIVGWSGMGEEVANDAAPAVLLPKALPWEYPNTVAGLLAELDRQGVGQETMLALLRIALLTATEDSAVYVIIGAPMRGVAGGERRQHLEVWGLDPLSVKCVRLNLNEVSDDPQRREIGVKAREILLEWASTARVAYAPVRENRPEVTTRRDEESALSFFRGKRVAIWGCGAIGGWAAELLARAGVEHLTLLDSGHVSPGILVRQPYDDADVGLSKANALSARLRSISPELDVIADGRDALDVLDLPGWCADFDLLVDATASRAVRTKMERARIKLTIEPPPLAAMLFGPAAQRGILALSRAEATGAPADVFRRTKLDVARRQGLSVFKSDFWQTATQPPFQPEPGCSDPTFRGSAADVAALVSSMVSALAIELAHPEDSGEAVAYLCQAPWAVSAETVRLSWPRDTVLQDGLSGYEVRISHQAAAEIRAWIARQARISEPDVETGGLLYGERDDAAGVLWVSEVIGPPPDSVHRSTEFLCGTAGVDRFTTEKSSRGMGSLDFVGMWHSHPLGEVAPSCRDVLGMAGIVSNEDPPLPKSLLLIAGGSLADLQVAAYLFRRRDLQAEFAVLSFDSTPHPLLVSGEIGRIGLALSGGGSRAIAFHLGCLRALHDRGVLESVGAISGVSGGAVLAAVWAYGDETFAEFDERLCQTLRIGLARSIFRQTLAGRNALSIAATILTAGVLAACSAMFRLPIRVAESLHLAPPGAHQRLQPPMARSASRTTSLADAVGARLVAEARMSDTTRNGIAVILTACELRTGAAFRFGNRETGCWRLGRLAENSMRVADAVAASAAYPLALPALDLQPEFVDKAGRHIRHRIVLTDGGVYDNLGITPFDPDRSAEFSFNNFPADYVISCDAGQGLWSGEDTPYYWPSRVASSFRAVFRKAQDAGRQRLHDWESAGRIHGFVMAYLGNQDRALPVGPVDLVPREDVIDYPTDFSAMSEKDLLLLTARGEQLTRLLLDYYCPEL